jgi:transcriptional regulator of acetoin/glycerol metabolism
MREEKGIRGDGQALTFENVDPVETSKAWSKFIANRNAPSMPISGVRALIYKSWMRSNTTGIRPEQFAAPSLNKTLVDDKQAFDQSEMRRATHACLHHMADHLSGAEAMLILTDKDGVILETVGDKSTLTKAGKINLSVGGVWSENASGTNGIGTALWMGKPVYVHGEEHFCEGMKAWSCAAAPIHDPVDQTIIGVINLSGLTSIFQKHNAAFAAALARDIDLSLLQSRSQMNFQLLEWAVGRIPRRVNESDNGITIIDRFGRLIFNHSSFGTLSDQVSPPALGKPFLNLPDGISEASIIAAIPANFICTDIQLIELDGTVNGASLILKDKAVAARPAFSAKRSALPSIAVGRAGLQIVGRSEAILAALDMANSLLDTSAPTLIQGPTGVGKALFARLIHAGRTTSNIQPFAPINCASLTREMLEADLAPFDAGSDMPPDPTNGTLCNLLVFDEIGELPFALQPLLLRLLENTAMLASNDMQKQSSPRILSLTNRRLTDEVAAGMFRADLYYRLGVIVLEIPPLRDRGEDVLLIFEHYNRLLSLQSGLEPLTLGADVEQALMAYDWPGNVRELRNAVLSIHFKAKSRDVSLSDLPFKRAGAATDDRSAYFTMPIPKDTQSKSLKDAELVMIESALRAHRGNLSKTAIALGISRPTLYRKMHSHGICFSNID